ncbi:hypothetical protein EGY27_16440 [Pseudomonas aeruginosa]|uniref:hypothetical protein n=1 Tax=Pseudomonas aeruginosa TaxID=287 RepID=UPI000F4D3F74|nr:hypothetical protein [Pseudomonas aeruginosa]AYZ84365.1 hypothetical protein EGY27_16440 [Pseudomonas aeruginosa]
MKGDERRRTIYQHQGYKLRSYTELMWARLMDAVDIFYLYEPHLIQVDGCKYLPDFYLPAADMYLEVKGARPTEIEVAKADQTRKYTGRPVVFLVSRPQSDARGFMNCYLLVPRGDEWVDMSLDWLGQILLTAAGESAWTKAILSVREDILDCLRPASEVVDEVLLEMMGRSEAEDYLRLTHKRTNEDRCSVDRELSMSDRGIAWWRNRYFPAVMECAESDPEEMRASK